MTKNNSKYPRANLAILIIQALIAITSVGVSVYFYSVNLQMVLSSQRADLSILDSVHWSMTNESFTLNVSGEIRNEGSRKTVVETIEIGVTYTLEHGFEQSFVRIITDPSSELGWENSTFAEEQSRQFVLTIDVQYILYQIETNQKPDRGWIRVKHYDGIGVQEQSSTFPIK